MADITKCANKKCLSNDTCYRFTAKPNPYRQSYWHIEDEQEHAHNCTKYWPDEDAIKKKDLPKIKVKK